MWYSGVFPPPVTQAVTLRQLNMSMSWLLCILGGKNTVITQAVTLRQLNMSMSWLLCILGEKNTVITQAVTLRQLNMSMSWLLCILGGKRTVIAPFFSVNSSLNYNCMSFLSLSFSDPRRCGIYSWVISSAFWSEHWSKTECIDRSHENGKRIFAKSLGTSIQGYSHVCCWEDEGSRGMCRWNVFRSYNLNQVVLFGCLSDSHIDNTVTYMTPKPQH
jgi:hypothetical protein